MSILYCDIPYFAAALARRDHPEWRDRPLILIGPEERVFAASADAAVCGVAAGMAARTARIRCPEAHLAEADVAHCRDEFEALLQLLERTGPKVEPHGWGAAYVDLEDITPDRADGLRLCQETGQAVRHELGEGLQPALGLDSGKFTAHAAARRTLPGRLLAVPTAREGVFLQPLPVSLLPLAADVVQRLGFLGLRTLGQYAALPPAAVWQQFGRAGMRAHHCARGRDDRPVISRWQAPVLAAGHDFEMPVVERGRLLAWLRRLIAPLLAELQGNLQACGQLRLAVHFDDGSIHERARAFLYPAVEEPVVTAALEQLLDQIQRTAAPADDSIIPTGVSALTVTLEQIQDVVMEQLTLFPAEDEQARKLREVQRYLANRFGASRLRRAVLTQPDAPLAEWRAGWVDEEEGP